MGRYLCAPTGQTLCGYLPRGRLGKAALNHAQLETLCGALDRRLGMAGTSTCCHDPGPGGLPAVVDEVGVQPIGGVRRRSNGLDGQALSEDVRHLAVSLL